jgi:hypothetical protein
MMKAFPHEEWLDSTDPKVLNPIRHPGMDLRDYFAARAMEGILKGWDYKEEGKSVFNPKAVAKRAWLMADRMMEERNGN